MPFWGCRFNVAFSICANNVANAAGPIASMTINELSLHSEKGFLLITILATLVVAPGFGIGSSLFGPRIVKNTAKKLFFLPH
jgi:sulfate permease